jgi:hypothetical protein
VMEMDRPWFVGVRPVEGDPSSPLDNENASNGSADGTGNGLDAVTTPGIANLLDDSVGHGPVAHAVVQRSAPRPTAARWS